MSPSLSGNSLLGVRVLHSLRDYIHQETVCSFVGVILIARPQFLFGGLKMLSDPSEITPTQRMLSVMSEGYLLVIYQDFRLT